MTSVIFVSNQMIKKYVFLNVIQNYSHLFFIDSFNKMIIL